MIEKPDRWDSPLPLLKPRVLRVNSDKLLASKDCLSPGKVVESLHIIDDRVSCVGIPVSGDVIVPIGVLAQRSCPFCLAKSCVGNDNQTFGSFRRREEIRAYPVAQRARDGEGVGVPGGEL